MNTAGKLLAAGVAVEAAVGVRRFLRRGTVFAQARARAKSLGRPLVVVGDPDGGAQTRLLRAYDCGDVTIDLAGAPACPRPIAADITQRVPVLSDSAVVYESMVLEYVDDPQAAWAELLRMAGSPANLYTARVDPYTLTSVLYPGAKWAIEVSADGTSITATPITDTRRAAYVLGVAGLAVGAML